VVISISGKADGMKKKRYLKGEYSKPIGRKDMKKFKSIRRKPFSTTRKRFRGKPSSKRTKPFHRKPFSKRKKFFRKKLTYPRKKIGKIVIHGKPYFKSGKTLLPHLGKKIFKKPFLKPRRRFRNKPHAKKGKGFKKFRKHFRGRKSYYVKKGKGFKKFRKHFRGRKPYYVKKGKGFKKLRKHFRGRKSYYGKKQHHFDIVPPADVDKDCLHHDFVK
jgi:hypothetical protein